MRVRVRVRDEVRHEVRHVQQVNSYLLYREYNNLRVAEKVESAK